ncbi:hypothetical protein HDU91_005831 [Kappamyces sp. JEL0680]|nr:hypothetical protein HDU91_005831 [Kappamyces sp. JEL0680]
MSESDCDQSDVSDYAPELKDLEIDSDSEELNAGKRIKLKQGVAVLCHPMRKSLGMKRTLSLFPIGNTLVLSKQAKPLVQRIKSLDNSLPAYKVPKFVDEKKKKKILGGGLRPGTSLGMRRATAILIHSLFDANGDKAFIVYTPPVLLSEQEKLARISKNPGKPADFEVEVVVDPILASVLRPHQLEGVQFLFDCTTGRKRQNAFGCIMADEMGLGKTLQCITLLWTLLRQSERPGIPTIEKAIIACPSSLVKNWANELSKWLGEGRVRSYACDGKGTKEQTTKDLEQFAFCKGRGIVYPVPTKYEYIVFCKMTDTQKLLYNHFAKLGIKKLKEEENADGEKKRSTGGQDTLKAMIAMKKIVNHPSLIAETEWPASMIPPGFSFRECMPAYSGKMFLLEQMIFQMRAETSDKIVIISNYTQTLDYIDKLCHARHWKSYRLDGTMAINKRQKMVDQFNDPASPYFIFLLSSKAGGCGINLIGANRLILFDPGQAHKQSLSSCVVDAEVDAERHFTAEGLKKLFEFNEETLCDTHDTFKCKRCKDGKQIIRPPEGVINTGATAADTSTWSHFSNLELHKVYDSLLLKQAKETSVVTYAFQNKSHDSIPKPRSRQVVGASTKEEYADAPLTLAFTNWINSYLKQVDATPIVDLATDLSSGENLILLLQIIGDESLGKVNRNPRIRLQKIENVNKALDFIRHRGVNLTNIGAEDIVDSNEKLIMGLIWTIILRFSIATISEEGLTAKEGLLLWCQRRTTPYAADFTIKDFTGSWQNGLALCGLIHRHRPDLINYWALDKSAKHKNTQLAFDVAEKHLNIPKLFAVEDVVDAIRPDERSVMTYVAQYFHAFSALGKFDVAGRRVGTLGNLLQSAWDMQHDYEKRARVLISNIRYIQESWSQATFSGYADAKQQLIEFETYKGTTKRSWVAEKKELDALLGNIQTKLKTYNLRAYVPPQELSIENLNINWKGLLQAEATRKRNITIFIRDSKDRLRKQFATAANAFQDSLTAISLGLSSLEGELENQLATTQNLALQTEPLKEQLQLLSQLDKECVVANIEDNEFTIFSVEDLSFELGLLTEGLSKKSAFIENQMVARSKTNFSPEQLEQYSETFRLFDKDNSNTLVREEFKAALQAEGTALGEAEFETTFLQVSQGTEEITFEQFIEYARSLEEDKVTPEALAVAFKTLASDLPYITEADLYRGGMDAQIVELLKSQLPKREEGYDYNAFLANVFI